MEDKLAYIFPGQGAQYVGMGKDIYEHFDYVKRIFDIASNITGIDLVQLCFEGPKEYLADTVLCQIAIFTVSIASLKSLQFCLEEKDVELVATATAGLSLGEYSSLVYAGCLSFEDGVDLVWKRAKYMKEAADKVNGSMASVIGLDKDRIYEICKEYEIDVANLNCPGQIVISGPSNNIKKSLETFKKANAKRVIPLRVKGAYHSRLMDSAKDKLTKFLKNVEIKPPNTLFISNVTGKYHIVPEEIRQNLISQVNSSVHWQKSMGLMLDTGITKFLEIGPGKVLAGLLRRIDRHLQIYNIETRSDILSVSDELEY